MDLDKIMDRLRQPNSTVNRNITLLPASFNVSGVLSMLDELFQTIVMTFKCIEHDYFEGFPDEESLVKRAINTSEPPAIASKCLLALLFKAEFACVNFQQFSLRFHSDLIAIQCSSSRTHVM